MLKNQHNVNEWLILFPYPESYRIALAPVITSIMVVWSLLLAAIMPDGHPVALYPLLSLFPIVSAVHLYLLVNANGLKRLDAFFYALVHVPLSFVVWTFCIMLVNGKSI